MGECKWGHSPRPFASPSATVCGLLHTFDNRRALARRPIEAVHIMKNEATPADRVLNAAELSRMYLPSRTPATISKDLSRRPHTLPPAIKIVGCPACWLESTVLEWLKRHERPAPPPPTSPTPAAADDQPRRRRGRPTNAARRGGLIMGRVSTVIPSFLLDSRQVIDLMPEQKLILTRAWSGHADSIGVTRQPARAEAAVLGLSEQAFVTGIETLVSSNLIKHDQETGEIFVLGWFRFHRFKGLGIKIARREFCKIESSAIREAVRRAAAHAGLNLDDPGAEAAEKHESPQNQPPSPPTQNPNINTDTNTNAVLQKMHAGGSSAAAATRGDSKMFCVVQGVSCWTDEDRLAVQDLMNSHGEEAVAAAAAAVRQQGVEPLPSRVARRFTGGGGGDGQKKSRGGVLSNDAPIGGGKSLDDLVEVVFTSNA